MSKKKLIRSKVNPLELRNLFFAGNARLTFRNQAKGTHMTVHVKQARDKQDRKKKLPIFFVNVSLLGDGEQGYVFGGTIFQDTMGIKLSRNTTWNTQLGKVMAFILHALKNPEFLREKNVALFHEGRCCRCGLPLTNPQSIDRGLGDDCYAYQKGTKQPQTTESPI